MNRTRRSQWAAARLAVGMILAGWAGATATAPAGPAPLRLVPSAASGWPQFRGPVRDGVCGETGLRPSWPEGGPPLLWKREQMGRGYSSPVFAGDLLCLTGDAGEDLVIFALDRNGNPAWQAVNGRSWQGALPGARASLTYDGRRLYHMNAHGRAVCLDPADGRELWAVDVLERFGAENIHWGMSECLLVDGVHVIVSPGGPRTLLAALDAHTGQTRWETGPLRFLRKEQMGGKPLDTPPREDCDRAGYASPILFESGNRRLLAGCSARHWFVADAARGKLVWTFPVEPARWEVIGTMPVAWGDRLVFSAPDFGTRCFRLAVEPDAVQLTEIWQAATDNCHGGMVAREDRLYGSGYRRSRDWVCLDLGTGQTRYSHPDLVKGSVLFAGDRIYALSERGTMALLKPTPGGFETVGKFELPKGALGAARQNDVWAHPVIHEGRLYLRNHDLLLCYDLRDPGNPAGSAAQ